MKSTTMLEIEYLSAMMVEGDGRPISNAINAILDSESLKDKASKAREKARNAISAVKAAHDNPYGNDDEAIANAILDGLHKQRAKKSTACLNSLSRYCGTLNSIFGVQPTNRA